SMSISGLLYSALIRGKTLRGHPSRIAETQVASGRRRQLVDRTDEREQRSDRALTQVEHQARQLHHVAVGDLRLQRSAAFDPALRAHIPEAVVEIVDLGIRRLVDEPEHEAIPDPAQGVVVAPKAGDVGDSIL